MARAILAPAVSITKIFDQACRLLMKNWAKSMGCILLVMSVQIGSSLVFSLLPYAAGVVGIIGILAYAVTAYYFLRLIRGEPVSREMITLPLRRIGIFIVSYFLVMIIILGGYLLLIIPGIVASFNYAVLPFVLVDEPVLSPRQALARSRALMYGHRIQFLGLMLLLLLLMIPFLLVFLIFFFILAFFVSPVAGFLVWFLLVLFFSCLTYLCIGVFYQSIKPAEPIDAEPTEQPDRDNILPPGLRKPAYAGMSSGLTILVVGLLLLLSGVWAEFNQRFVSYMENREANSYAVQMQTAVGALAAFIQKQPDQTLYGKRLVGEELGVENKPVLNNTFPAYMFVHPAWDEEAKLARTPLLVFYPQLPAELQLPLFRLIGNPWLKAVHPLLVATADGQTRMFSVRQSQVIDTLQAEFDCPPELLKEFQTALTTPLPSKEESSDARLTEELD